MFCFKCGASMPEDSQVCPKCAAPVQPITPPPQGQQPGTPAQTDSNQSASNQASSSQSQTSAWLNAPAAPQQNFQQPQYPPQAQPNPYYNQYPQQTDTSAVISMILGIMSFALCLSFLTGIPAIILGHISRSKIAKSAGRLKGDGMALTGLILGYCSLPFILIIVAIAIPNFMKARNSANESTAASYVRTINTAQVTYETTYPSRGYAPDLATLGPGSSISCSDATAEHACLLDGTLGAPRCTSGTWCLKGMYRFTIVSNCKASATPAEGEDTACKEFVVAATPLNNRVGFYNFCSTSDAIVRRVTGAPLLHPPTAEECGEWPPI